MNELIQSLSSQAKANVPAGLEVNKWICEYNEQLGQLIILECERIINQTPSQWPYAAVDFIQAIKQHFGVET